MINSYQNEKNAASRRQDIGREVAAADLRRQAKMTRRADGPSERAVDVRFPDRSAIGSVAGAWRGLGRGLRGVVGRHAPA